MDFKVTDSTEAHIEIYNVYGQMVWSKDFLFKPGVNSVKWEGTDSEGKSLESGVYFYKASINGETKTRKMLLMKE